MKKNIVLINAIFLLFFSSCGIFQKNEHPPSKEELAEIPFEENIEEDIIEAKEPKIQPVYKGSRTLRTDIIHTKLHVNFNWDKSEMNGKAYITARPYFYPSNELNLDAKYMLIHSVRLNGKPLNYEYDGMKLKIELDKIYTRDESYTIEIDYTARPEEVKDEGGTAVTGSKGLYFINPKGEDPNKMPQIWTQGEPESSSVWFPTIDSPNVKTTQEIFITVNDKYVTLSNGKLISSKKIASGKRVDHWKQDKEHAPYLFMMAVGEFSVVKDYYERKTGEKMPVFYYVEKEWEEYADDIFDETPEMIEFFEKILGVDYPWDKYHQIVVRDYVSGAMENTSAVIFGDFVYKTDRELIDENSHSIIAHELFHHWFGDLVTCESWANLTLNESFANYSQYLWDEYRYGKDEADYNAITEREGYFQSAAYQGYHDLVWFQYEKPDDMFDGHSYNKGGRILHMLRNYLGDEAFFAGLKKYLNDNKFQSAEFHQLRIAFEKICGEDLNWFFNQWYLGSGHPVLDISREIDTTNQKIHITIEQKQDLEEFPLFFLPTKIAVYDDKGEHVYPIIIKDEINHYTFDYDGQLYLTLFDPEQILLGIKNELHKTTEEYKHQFFNSKAYEARLEGMKKGIKFGKKSNFDIVKTGLGDSFWDIRRYAVSKLSSVPKSNRIELKPTILEIGKNDPSSKVRYEIVLQSKKILSGEEILSFLEDRIKNDSSYLVTGAALKKTAELDPQRALLLAESLEKERSSTLTVLIADIYSNHGDSSKINFYETAFKENRVANVFDKLGLINSFTMYVGNQNNINIYEKSVPVYDLFKKNKNIYTRAFIPKSLEYLIDKIDAQINTLKNSKMEEIQKNELISRYTKVKEHFNEIIISLKEEH